MKEIKLTQGKVALVDDEDFEYLNQFKWCAIRVRESDCYYASRGIWNGKRMLPIKMHRVIMNAQKGEIIDHIDGNGLNNQKSTNLRFCTAAENSKNRRSSLNCSSQYLGVSFDKQAKMWKSCIRLNGKTKHIGRFKTEENAAIAYNIWAEKVHGKFARYNIA